MFFLRFFLIIFLVRIEINEIGSDHGKSCYEKHARLHLQVTIGASCEAVLILDDNMQLSDIQIIRSKAAIDIAKLIYDAGRLPKPQDLRYAIMSLGAQQVSEDLFKVHLSDLRRKALVRQTGPFSVTATYSNGITASFVVHNCYPDVPTGVQIESLTGVGGWDAAELQIIKDDVNARLMCTIQEAFSSLSELIDLRQNEV